jgi:serine phosphatase RsbU (regulator of sigma subunit)
VERKRGPSILGRILEAAEAASPVESVEAVTRELGKSLRASAVSFLIADLSGRALIRLAHVPLQTAQDARSGQPLAAGERREAGESATRIPFDGGVEEQTVRTQSVQVLGPAPKSPGSGGSSSWRVLAPVTERGEAIGVLEVILPDQPDTDDVEEIAQLSHILAFVLIANRRHTDLYEWGQRSRPLSLSAEIQHRLLAGPQTCEAGSFTLAGWLEPAATIAGDTFDFSLVRDVLHLSITDAMGHGVNAALSATLCVGSLRNTRYEGGSLLEQVAWANQALTEYASGNALEDFVTGVVGRLDLRTGSMELVNAGHVSPYMARGQQVASVELPADLPMGLFPDTSYHRRRVALEPGDRVVFVTDGMLERNAAGIDLLDEIGRTRELHPREAVRELADRVLEATNGALRDDATVLCLDWHGNHGQDRLSVYGADHRRARTH